jgi:hypothetical protein
MEFKGGIMDRYVKGGVICGVLSAFLFSAFIPGIVSAAQEETVVGTVVKSGKGFVIEADDGDYIVKGKDLSKMVGKLVEATGTITDGDKGDSIDVKSVEEIQE